jgi:hypothetical protein
MTAARLATGIIVVVFLVLVWASLQGLGAAAGPPEWTVR